MHAAGSNFVEIANFASAEQSIQKIRNDLSPHVLTILGDFTRYIRLIILYENKNTTIRCTSRYAKLKLIIAESVQLYNFWKLSFTRPLLLRPLNACFIFYLLKFLLRSNVCSFSLGQFDGSRPRKNSIRVIRLIRTHRSPH